MSLSEGNANLKKERARASRSLHGVRKFQVWFVWLTLVSAAAGCAGPMGTGLCVPMSSQEKKAVLEELKSTWQNYNVYCDGPVTTPGALIFDPKDDDRNLIGYQYIKLSKEASVRTAIVWIEFDTRYVSFLYSIFDGEKKFYGYVFIAGHLPMAWRVDQNTLQLPQFESTLHLGD
jgi:hypothetical protein